MAGRFEFTDDVLLFRPRFPFADGVDYHLIERGADAGSTMRRPARPGAASTSVTAICPSGPAVPLNLLRCYVHFSAPMSEGSAAQSVRLSDADTGEPMPDAILAMEPELWDPQHTRLTLLLDPGRIKRGLRPHLDAGYPLVEGRRVTLSVETTFLDARGQPLVTAGRRDYRVGDAERRHVRPEDWTVAPPPAHTRLPLTVTFDRPMDHALALRCLRVLDGHGAIVGGRVALAEGEMRWRFDPTDAWGQGPYTLTVDPILEDVAGNSISRVFDRDLDRTEDDPRDANPTTIAFSCA